jgi:mannosyltransferase OCH1-like enzyme
VLKIPDTVVDITTVNTLVQLVTPGLKLVLDPMMYLRSMTHSETIPKVIHMTMRSKHKVAPHQVLSILSWGKLNHGYTLLMYDDADMEQYMKFFFPKFMDVYRRLTTPVERSDVWRYHVLCQHGGVYADTDTICARSFDSWLTQQYVANLSRTTEPGFVVGIENVFPSQEAAEEATYVRKVQMIQWTMASRRAHPIVCSMGKAVRSFMDREETDQLDLDAKMGHDASILLRTGPGIWTDGVQEFLQELQVSLDQMVGGGQISDVVVLPQAALGCNVR